MAIERLDIVIQGSGPYGFRLSGGDGKPLTVTKLRQQSKACDAGLHEGDILLGINEFECRTMSHSSAMALLENAVDYISLSVFRGSLDELDSAFDAMSSTLRPLSPGSLPPPLRLPPPPAAALSSSGDLVIDQPSFLRQKWAQAAQPVSSAAADTNHIGAPPPIFAAPPPAPIAEPRVFDACPPQPLPAADTPLPTFRVKPFSAEAKQWMPYNQQTPVPAAPTPQPQQGGPVQVSRHLPDSTRSHKWQPTETPVLIPTHTDVNLDPEPEPEPVETVTTWPTPPLGRVSMRLDHGDGHPEHVEVVPRWALPLRSEYDWRLAYNLGDSDEWELTEDGDYCIRRKKIFADSSFYDEPEHKYPTIEEQIKMARKVAQSLTASGNVKARGQRMFLRRREKADQWVADAFGPRQSVRRAAAARAAAAAEFMSELESEQPYYNPAPWMPSTSRPLPWAQAGGGPTPVNPSWAPKAADTSPSMSGNKWQPYSVHHVEPAAPMTKHSGNVPPQVAFGLAKDLARMGDKGGKMFAKRRQRAAVEETEDYTSESARGDVMQRIVDSYVPPQAPSTQDVVDNSLEQPTSATRLLNMIERSRSTVTSYGPPVTHPTTGGREPTRTISFTTTTKTQSGGFRPVRFRAPLVVTAADIAVAELEQSEGISDF